MQEIFRSQGKKIVVDKDALFPGSPQKEWITQLAENEASSAARILSAKQELSRLSTSSGPDGRARNVLNILEGNEVNISVNNFVSPDREVMLKMLHQLTKTLNDEILTKRPTWLTESENMGIAISTMLEAVQTFPTLG